MKAHMEKRGNSTWKTPQQNRNQNNSKPLPQQKLSRKSRKQRLNISRTTEQALKSILDYLETQNIERSHFLMNVLFKRKFSGPEGI